MLRLRYCLMRQNGCWQNRGICLFASKGGWLFWDDIALNLLQLHMQEEQWDAALTFGLDVREERLDYRYADQLGYLLGYIYFKQFDFTSALDHFSEVLIGIQRVPYGRPFLLAGADTPLFDPI